MRDSLAHRGPDDAGAFRDGLAALAHRRLSIVDLETGQQPMSNEDRSVWVSFNGEIYNHSILRQMLARRGHVYSSSSDTESIVHLYEEFGEAAVERLEGMFAFAVWDQKTRTLLLARDRLGIKPLYYHLARDGSIHFASEIKALLNAGVVRPSLNFEGLGDYAANRACHGEDTLFEEIKRLRPGHTLVWSNGIVRTRRYWEASFNKEETADGITTDDILIERFRDLFDESVRTHLMADVPLGMFLSGGIDSSAIAASMQRAMAGRLNTFSVAFAEREANELHYARLVARALGTRHHELTITPEEFFGALPGLVYQEDEPIAHPSSVPLYFLSALAARSVKVALTGEGSDELLAGYGKFRKTIVNVAAGRVYARSVPAPVRAALARLLEESRIPLKAGQKLRRTFLSLPPNLESIYFDNFAVFSRRMQTRLFSPDTLARIGPNPHRHSLEAIAGSDASALLDKLLVADMKTYLHELLMKQDQMSMAASLETRVPFLDHKLVEFATRLPLRLKLRGLATKYILRRAMKDRLPAEVISRSKQGFPVPLGSWLRGPFTALLDEYVLGIRARARGIFNPAFAAELVARHRAGENHTERLWALINFEIWQRRFFDGEPASVPAGRANRPLAI
jgi:asparagine synthase (glutamine-hydrolysing)